MYYYKYCSPGDRQFGMLSRGEIFFASADELNDGSECRPRYVLKGVPELWHRLFDLILFETLITYKNGSSLSNDDFAAIMKLSKPFADQIRKSAGRKDLDFGQLWPLISKHLPPHLKSTGVKLPSSIIMNLARDFIRGRLLQFLNENTYMSCFSRDPRNPTMWGHYAGADRGFCIVFRATRDKLRLCSPIRIFCRSQPDPAGGITRIGIYNDVKAQIVPVLYRPAPARFNAFHRFKRHFRYSEEEEHYDVPLLLDTPSRQEGTFGSVKASTWKYEQEVRAILPTTEDLTPESRCIRLERGHFQGLIFGPKMSAKDKKRAVVACHILGAKDPRGRVSGRPFVFFDAAQRIDSFRMEISPIGVLGKHYCQGILPFESLRDANGRTSTQTRQIFQEMRVSS